MRIISVIILTISAIFAQTTCLSAQNGWFKTYDFGYTSGQQPWGIKEQNGYIYMLRFTNNRDSNITQNGVTKLDGEGNVLWSTNAYYPPEANSWNIGHFVRDIEIAKDGSAYFYSGITNKMLVNKFSTDGKLLWYRAFDNGALGSEDGHLGLELTEDSLAVYVAGKTGDGKEYVLMKLDSSGAIVWKKIFPVKVKGFVGHSQPIIRLPDNSLVGAYDNNYIIDRMDYLMRTDSAGNPVKFYTSPFMERPRDLALHPNGNFVYLSDEDTPPFGEYGGMRVQMFTPNLDTVWTRLYNDFQLPCVVITGAFVRNLSIRPDGRILASVAGSPNCLNLVTFSPSGKKLLDQQVYVDKPEPYSYGQEIYGAIWTSDGGILVRGYLNYNQGPRQKAFLMKLDSVGCLEPNCNWTAVTAAQEPVRMQADCWQISPNPTPGRLRMDYAETCGQDLGRLQRLELFDSRGALIRSMEGPLAMPGEINLGDLPTGIYHLRGIFDGHYVMTKKVMVQ